MATITKSDQVFFRIIPRLATKFLVVYSRVSGFPLSRFAPARKSAQIIYRALTTECKRARNLLATKPPGHAASLMARFFDNSRL